MTRIFAAFAALALVLTACSSSGSGVSSADSAAFCTTLAQYTQSLTDFKQLPADATVADYQAAATDVKVQLAALTAASGDYVGAQLQELQTAQDDLVAATEGLTADFDPGTVAGRDVFSAGRRDRRRRRARAGGMQHDTDTVRGVAADRATADHGC